MSDLPFSLPDPAPGWVWLVGAGPGDPGLMTLLAAHALARADVILHDALLDPAVLGLARPDAVREPVGKRAGRASPRQDAITERLIHWAGQGRRVVRLKGGDPWMFGRAAEEIAGLAAAGVPFRVVPGVSSGLAGPAYAGIPVTDADHSGVMFASGTDARGAVAPLDWAAIARAAPVLVLFMGVRRLGDIAERLIAGGRPADEPVALIAQATRADQQVVTTTLADCGAAAATVTPPALVVIGRTVARRPDLAWFAAPSPGAGA